MSEYQGTEAVLLVNGTTLVDFAYVESETVKCRDRVFHLQGIIDLKAGD